MRALALLLVCSACGPRVWRDARTLEVRTRCPTERELYGELNSSLPRGEELVEVVAGPEVTTRVTCTYPVRFPESCRAERMLSLESEDFPPTLRNTLATSPCPPMDDVLPLLVRKHGLADSVCERPLSDGPPHRSARIRCTYDAVLREVEVPTSGWHPIVVR
jgi:hypothetical protein